MGSESQCLAFTLFFLQACEACLSCRMLPEAEDGRCGESPRERRMADGGAGGAGTFSSRCRGACAPTARGGTILPPRETVDLRDCVEQHAAEARADAGHRVPQIQGMGVMARGRVADGACDVAPPRIVGGDERAIHCEARVHRRRGTALGDPISVGGVGDLCCRWLGG